MLCSYAWGSFARGCGFSAEPLYSTFEASPLSIVLKASWQCPGGDVAVAALPATPPETVTANVKLSTPEWDLSLKVTVPTGPTRLRQMLPLVQALTDSVVGCTIGMVEQNGRKIS